MKPIALDLQKYHDSEYDITYRAETPFVCYRVYVVIAPCTVIVDYSVSVAIRNVHQGKYPDKTVDELVEIGKAAAQRDFDERVLRCLSL